MESIKYEKINDGIYEMTLFDDENLEIFPDSFTFNVSNPAKTIYQNFISLQSGVENLFVTDCESSENVEFYFKLPNWFKINTPIGTYNPDWAIVYKSEEKIYFVTETKSAGQELRDSEKMKIKCGKAHFKSLDEIKYEQVTKVSDLNNF